MRFLKIIAAVVVIAGLLVFVLAMTACGWDFARIGFMKSETNLYNITDDFNDIDIKTSTADVTFLPSEDGGVKVECIDKVRYKHTSSVKDGKLVIELVDERRWYEHINLFDFYHEHVTVFLPGGEYNSLTMNLDTGDVSIPGDFKFSGIDISLSTGDVTCRASASDTLKIKASTGDLLIENITCANMNLKTSTGNITVSGASLAGDINIEVSTGKVNLADINCGNLITEGSTGKLNMRKVVASGKFDIERSTGDVNFDGCDAAEIYVEVDTGDVRGTLLSDKVYIVETDTGNVDVPKTITGGRCEISTDTGDVKISVNK